MLDPEEQNFILKEKIQGMEIYVRDLEAKLERAAKKINKLDVEKDWLLERVGIDRNGIFLTTGNAKLDNGQSRKWLEKHLKNSSEVRVNERR